MTNLQSADKLVIRSEPKCKSHLPRPECSRGATKCAPVQGAAEPQYTPLAGEMSVECEHQAFTVCAVCVYFKDTFLLMLIAAAVKTGFNVKFTEKANYAANHFLCCLCV